MLTDSCAVVRRTPGAFNPGTGGYAPPSDAAIYAGPCRVEPLSGVAPEAQVGQEAVVERGKRVFLPVDEVGPTVEDVLTMTSAEDVSLIGREMVIRDVAADHSPLSAVAARWVICEDFVEGP